MVYVPGEKMNLLGHSSDVSSSKGHSTQDTYVGPLEKLEVYAATTLTKTNGVFSKHVYPLRVAINCQKSL